MKGRTLQNIKFCAIVIVVMALVSTLVIPLAASLTNSITLRSSGQISNPNVTARSGSARDIQAAIDQVVAHGGVGSVYIPEGTFNFVEVGEPWVTVNIPESVSIYGAPTVRDSNDQVTEWKTILVMPYEVPTGATWFEVNIVDNEDVSFRFSDIKLVGWRYFDYLQNGEPEWQIPYDPNEPSDRGSETMYRGLKIYNSPYGSDYVTDGILNFRVDHCHFQDMCGTAVWVGSSETQYNRHVINGVIDHNILANSYGDPGRLTSSEYEYRTLGYGIGMRRWACDLWENDVHNIFGKYNDNTIFIEDNFFSKWRHSTCSNDGLHAVIRNNVFGNTYGVGEVDAHGSYATETREYAVGTRAMEVYNNIFKNPVKIWDPKAWAINVRGGAATIFNNTLIGFDDLVYFNNEWGNSMFQPKCSINDVYIWGNNLGGGRLIGYQYGAAENVNFFLRQPNLAYDGFEYEPYQNPHPLTLGETP